MSDKIYAPVMIKTYLGKFGETLKLSFNADKLIEFANAHKNDKGYINLNINKRKEVGKYGETHSAVLDTWQPTVNNPAPAFNNQDDLP